MRKIFSIICLLFTLCIGSSIYASSDISIIIDNQQKTFTPGPIIQNESTLVPMRAIFEDLGAKIYWYDSTKTVIATRDSTKIKLTIGSNEGFINNNKFILSATPQIIDEKTYVPLRFIGEALGAQVNWDGETRTITIRDKTKITIINPTLIDTQKYELRTAYKFVNNGDDVSLDFVVLSGAQSTSPYQKDSMLKISPDPYEITLDEYGNEIIKIKANSLKKEQPFNIVVSKELSNSGIKYDIDKDNISNDYSMLDGYSTYTAPQILIESSNDKIINKAKQVGGQERNPYELAKKFYEFVNLSLTYDLNEDYAGKGALSALETKRGVCEEYAKLFAALLRSKGIPARTVYGYWLQEDTKKTIGYEWYDVKELRHEWPEFYLPGYGWIIAEPTYQYTLNGEKTVPWEQFANQDSHGHIVDGYKSNNLNQIKWSVRGYGRLDVKLEEIKTEIRKIK